LSNGSSTHTERIVRRCLDDRFECGRRIVGPRKECYSLTFGVVAVLGEGLNDS
jgi:hypothetical protein